MNGIMEGWWAAVFWVGRNLHESRWSMLLFTMPQRHTSTLPQVKTQTGGPSIPDEESANTSFSLQDEQTSFFAGNLGCMCVHVHECTHTWRTTWSQFSSTMWVPQVELRPSDLMVITFSQWSASPWKRLLPFMVSCYRQPKTSRHGWL